MFNVLIADDDPFILEGLRHIVDWKGLGLQITAAVSTGKEALEYIRCHPVDILLTDVKMPELDGISLIRTLRQEGNDISCIILSGYDDYPYMKQALQLNIENYLIKSVNENELMETLQNIVEKLERKKAAPVLPSQNLLKENVLQRWAGGRIDRREFEERMDFLGLPVESGYFQVCALRVVSEDRGFSAACLTRLSEEFSFPENTYHFLDVESDLIWIAFHKDPECLRDDTAKWAASLHKLSPFPHLISLGRCVKGYWNVPESFRQAKQLLAYCLMISSPQIVVYDEPRPEQEKIKTVPNSDMELFYQALIQNDESKALALLQKTYEREYDFQVYAADYLQSVTLRVFFVLTDALHYLQLEPADLLLPTELFYKQAASFRQRDSLFRWVTETTRSFFQLKKREASGNSAVLERMQNYVKSHYHEDISLKTLSYLLNANAAYLGRVFKEAYGQSFSSYLNRVRIDKAKMLLNETNCTVHEIAEKIGYHSTNYFVNVFKKFTGYFPSQYRSLHNG